MLLYVWGMGNLDLYHTLVEGSDNLWLIIATKNKKKMTTSLSDPQTLWGSFGVTVKQLSIPLLDEELPTPIWLSFWENQIKFLITLHVGTTILHVGTTVQSCNCTLYIKPLQQFMWVLLTVLHYCRYCNKKGKRWVVN